MSSPHRDGISLIIPAKNSAGSIQKIILGWEETLRKVGRDYEIIVVDNGSTDATWDVISGYAESTSFRIQPLQQAAPGGLGACLRSALQLAKFPILCYAQPGYETARNELRKLLERFEVRDDVLHKNPDLISAARPGREAPFVAYWIARSWHLFWRIAAGMEMRPAPPWFSWREFCYSNLVSWVFGVPLVDVNSGLKLYRTDFLKRFPIQSDGDFVQVELVAKATFLTSIIDEVPLGQPPDPDHSFSSVGREMWRVFTNPEFIMPEPPSQAGVAAQTAGCPDPDGNPNANHSGSVALQLA